MITWGLILCNLAYNRQIQWYIQNMDCGIEYDRSYISDLLISEGVKRDDATSIINAFKRFCDLPLGTVLNWGRVEEKGRQIKSLCRTKCIMPDNRVILYSLYLLVEKRNIEREFNLSYLMEDDSREEMVSPIKVFCLSGEEEIRSIFLGLSARYPDYINATYTNDLNTITLRDKTSADVLTLFEEG